MKLFGKEIRWQSLRLPGIALALVAVIVLGSRFGAF